ncbi:MAG TPA: hypothetical protein VNU71_08600 [Burkholderiaceae bacterium]|nr:hypothetical protein [Burkholderiaceae bacterium]
MTSLALANSGFAPFYRSAGVSADARRAETVTRKVLHDVKVAPASAMSSLLSELLTLAREDGIDPGALAMAMEFAVTLPPDVRLPEMSIDPDGEVAFDWGSEHGIVSVSVGATGRIVYAAELGGQPTSGTTQLSGEVPGPLRASLAAFRTQR